MRKAKRILSILIAVVVMFGAVKIPMVARAAAGDGMTFVKDVIYFSDKQLGDAPKTYEAVVNISTFSPGAIIGNLYGANNGFVLEIYNKHPRLYISTTTGLGYFDVCFNEVTLELNKDTHLAVVHEGENTIKCYVDGVLKQTLNGYSNAYSDKSNDGTAVPYVKATGTVVVGGDQRAGNNKAFAGKIKSVALYSDIRTADEIVGDVTAYGSDNLKLHYDLTNVTDYPAMIADKSGNGFDAYYEKWTDAQDYVSVTDYDFSLAVVGDTQCINDYTNERYNRLTELYEWIADNADGKKMQYVLGLGDITENQNDEEYANAVTSIQQLDGVVPYSLIRGNHDSSDERFSTCFNYSGYTNQIKGWYEEGNLNNMWMEFSVAGLRYLILALDYGPSNAVLAWAEEVIATHPEHNVIITTHAYLYRNGETLNDNGGMLAAPTKTSSKCENNGDDIWEKLGKKYANISMILSGHDPYNDIILAQAEGEHGNIVTQMLIDPQDMDERYQNLGEDPTGMVAMFYFSNGGKTVDIEYYSTIRDAYWGETIHLDNINVVDNGNEEEDDICSHEELKHYPKVDETPTENGRLEHWVCQTCEVKFSDAACTKVVTDVVIPSYGKAGGKLEIAGASVTLEDKVLLNVVVDKTTLDNGEYVKPYVRVALNGDETTIRKYTTTEDAYIFTYGGVAPHQMNDTLYITLCAESRGKIYSSEMSTYSIGEYCYNTLRDTEHPASEELKTLLVDLLNYGAAAQSYNEYRKDALVNNGLTDAEKAFGSTGTPTLEQVTASEGEDKDVVWKSATLILKDAVSLRFKVDVGEKNIDAISVQIKDSDGAIYNGCTTRFAPIEGSLYYVYVEGLTIAQMEKEIRLTVREAVVDEDSEGNSVTSYNSVSKTLNYSIATYAAKKMDNSNLGMLMKAMMNFGQSAVAYKNSL